MGMFPFNIPFFGGGTLLSLSGTRSSSSSGGSEAPAATRAHHSSSEQQQQEPQQHSQAAERKKAGEGDGGEEKQQQQQAELIRGSSLAAAQWPLLSSSMFLNNPYFSAGFGLAVLGCGAAAGRRGWQLLLVWGRRRLLTSLEIPVRDPSYPWVLQWLVSRGNISNHLGVSTTYCKDKAGNVSTRFSFIPSPGRHVMRYKETLVVVERMRSGEIVDMQTGTPWEALTLQTLSFKKKVILDLLEEARRDALAREAGKTVIYHSVGSEWRKYGEPKTIRPFSSVVLADGVAEQVHSDICSFLASSRWYLERGIPYRRGYLLHGPPGCGKSSFVMALAGCLKYNICVMNVGDPLMTDDRLQFLLATVPPQTLLLLEDIDGAIEATEGSRSSAAAAAAAAGEGRSNSRANPFGLRGVTFSGLLNALDGVVATEERITFMTTNHPERLPDSLIRPGRVDIKVRIGYATPSQLRRQFLRFFPNEETAADSFVDILKDVQLSMAELQGFFQFCREDVSQAITMAAAWRKADSEARELVLRERGQSPASSHSSSSPASDAPAGASSAASAATPSPASAAASPAAAADVSGRAAGPAGARKTSAAGGLASQAAPQPPRQHPVRSF